MNQCNINLLDLPTEILLTIFKKLDNMDVLYSLFDINNQRLDNIIQENTFTNTLNFVLTTLTNDFLSISDPILDRFCTNILPKIHYNVKSLILNSLSMERILLVADYSNLCEIKIFNFNIQSPCRRLFQRQITDLILVFENYVNEISCKHYTTDSFPSLVLRNLPITTCYSSTLSKLCINVIYYDDLLDLLDGRLKQLHTLRVVIINQEYNSTNVYNINNLSDLKYFYLQYDCLTDTYNSQILPLLRRMSNIEVLNLHLTMDNQTTFIDGKHIYNEIIVHMSRLHTFNFCFCTFIPLDHLFKDDILQIFPSIIYQQVDCMIEYQDVDVKYHVFTLPFMFDYLPYIDNTFPNIIFNHVIRLVIEDEISLEHEFFMRIVRSFPLLKILHVINLMPQSPISNELDSNDNELYSTIIKFPYLTTLNLQYAYPDYIEQFLNDKKTHLPYLTKLTVGYYELKSVTRNFTNDRTRLNCMKVKQLNMSPKMSIHSEDFYAYSPSL
ncbi:unnamed protein product [Rotaria sordida]|uniref:F-box domain-containing protein n=1 Tax=Rotaria sordida TaxID=392033 RepID=A0A814S4B9_9BILA|nr:unnamed protein product [Rotaria sordida]CAF1371519.1 unnamed protein product [Rotaria sordida]